MIKLDCLRDCNAACCKRRKDRRVVFDFSEEEAQMFESKGVTLVRDGRGGYMMPDDCIFLRGKYCGLHGKPTQPTCCVDNKVGEELCLWARQSLIDRRWNEAE